MAHIRLDDKRIELSMGEPRVGTGDSARVRLDARQEKWILEPALGTAAAPLDWECPTIGGNRAVVSKETPMPATLEVVTEGVSKQLIHRPDMPLAHFGLRGDRAPDLDTAVRFRGVKVIFRSEPEIVDADGATDLLVIQDC